MRVVKMRVVKWMGAVLLATLAVTSAWAQPDVDASRRNAIVQAIEKVTPAVVSINVVQLEAERLHDPYFRDYWGLFYAPRPQYRLRERRVDSVGSGFFIDRKGYIVTNYHVLEDADAVRSVTLGDGRTLDVEVVGGDERTDLAVLHVKEKDLPSTQLGNSDNLMIGEWVIAIGNPFGTLINDPQPSVSVGVVSANHRRISPSIGQGERLYQDMVQTDAAINPGNSGGPLVNAIGEVVGLNTMIFSPSGGSVGLWFAIPINRVRRVTDEIIQYGRRRDPWAGFKVEDVAAIGEDFRRQLGLKGNTGCVVINILKDSPAYQAGLRPGDTILQLNDTPISTSTDLDFAVWNLFVGDSVTLKVERQGAPETFRFTIKELVQ